MPESDFKKFFNPFHRKPAAVDSETEEFNLNNEVVDFAATPYFTKFIDWLDREASKPLIVGNHSDMIQSAVRANTLREIRDTLVRRVATARAAMTGDEE